MRAGTTLLLLAALCAAEEAGGAGKTLPFDWRQLGGSATHADSREQKDTVAVPKVLWHAPQAVGQPTLLGGWIYSGGPLLGRIAASTGKFEKAHAADTRAVGATPVITDDAIIVRRPDGAVEAYSHDLRKRIWQTPTLAPEVHAAHPLAWHERFVVLNAGNDVLALRARDGKIQWRFSTRKGEVAMTPAIADGRVLFGCVAGGVWAFELASGRQLWHLAGREHYGYSNPVVSGTKLVLADRGINYAGQPGRTGLLHGIDTARGKILWSLPYGKHRISTPGVANNRIVLGTHKRVFLVDSSLGKEVLPRITIESGAFGTPAIVGSTLYFGTDGGYLHARDLRTGSLKWRLRIPGKRPNNRPHEVRSIVHTGTRIYVETTNGLYSLGQDPNRRGVRPQNETITAPE